VPVVRDRRAFAASKYPPGIQQWRRLHQRNHIINRLILAPPRSKLPVASQSKHLNANSPASLATGFHRQPLTQLNAAPPRPVPRSTGHGFVKPFRRVLNPLLAVPPVLSHAASHSAGLTTALVPLFIIQIQTSASCT
jgi:hypothetical protein